MTYISIELNTGTKYTVDDDYTNVVARLQAAREDGRLVKLKLFGDGGEVQVNPKDVASVQPFPVA